MSSFQGEGLVGAVGDLYDTALRVGRGDVCPGELSFAWDQALPQLQEAGFSRGVIDTLRQQLGGEATRSVLLNGGNRTGG